MSETDVLIAHAATTWFMTGLIWFVQVVHYPLMASVGESRWVEYSRRHQFRTTLVVGPVMLAEALGAAALVPPIAVLLGLQPATPTLAWIGIALLAVVWASTAFLQVPAHATLAEGFSRDVQSRLVRTNWLRTVAWTARGVVALLMLLEQLSANAPAH
ncbi:MAG: hypothetical protein ACYTGR_02615 [Planctomycetota bacterium]|jgi:hypothetical protein